jgi:hypothetical protein
MLPVGSPFSSVKFVNVYCGWATQGVRSKNSIQEKSNFIAMSQHQQLYLVFLEWMNGCLDEKFKATTYYPGTQFGFWIRLLSVVEVLDFGFYIFGYQILDLGWFRMISGIS